LAIFYQGLAVPKRQGLSQSKMLTRNCRFVFLFETSLEVLRRQLGFIFYLGVGQHLSMRVRYGEKKNE